MILLRSATRTVFAFLVRRGEAVEIPPEEPEPDYGSAANAASQLSSGDETAIIIAIVIFSIIFVVGAAQQIQKCGKRRRAREKALGPTPYWPARPVGSDALPSASQTQDDDVEFRGLLGARLKQARVSERFASPGCKVVIGRDLGET